MRIRPLRDGIVNGTTNTEAESRRLPASLRAAGTARIDGLRRLLLGVLCFGMIGTGLELFLLEHTEDTFQWVPLILLAIGFVSAAALAVRGSRRTLRVFQVLMVLFIASGITGVYLHYKGNVEFELEMYPTMRGLELVWEALRGATPSLAPGTMVLFGLIGLTSTYDHPAARTGRTGISSEEVS